MSNEQEFTFFGFSIWGQENGIRLESRLLEEKIQRNVAEGHRRIEIRAFGQHGIGGRLWVAGNEKIRLRVTGSAGQRIGAMGFPNTVIEVMGPVSDDVGWLNAGAKITVLGHAGNGACNAMAQGKVYIRGNIGSRGMTMTKCNPRFDQPELWVLGSCGDYFAEFMAGGTAVVCGHIPQDSENILGYRPCVGMVGGKIFFRGPHKGYSQTDARLIPISDEDWQWLTNGLKEYLDSIQRIDLLSKFTMREQWQLIKARTHLERVERSKKSMKDYHLNVWEEELGKGGIVGDLQTIDTSPIALLPTGNLRRWVPIWENRKYAPPCQTSCPTGIPVHDRWRLVRDGRIDEAIDLALAYTPFPATVCGYLCPNLCMQGCTRNDQGMKPVNVKILGKQSVNAHLPNLPELSGKRVAVIGGGVAGISVAWQLRNKGHEAVVYDRNERLGGKLATVIPNTRIPEDIIDTEIDRINSVLPHVHLHQDLNQEEAEKLASDYDAVVIASGAQIPRVPPIPGKEYLIPALDFLRDAKKDKCPVGEKVVVIGAGNVGCDVATEAFRLGAKDVLLIDIQEPASFGEERDAAEKAGARFQWPCFTEKITSKGVHLKSGEILPADTVIISIGDQPDLSFLPKTIQIDRGFVKVNDIFQTTDPDFFAIGDAVRPGLLTDAIGAGRVAASAINDIFEGKRPKRSGLKPVDRSRIKLTYYDPRMIDFKDTSECGTACASCGSCKDCSICVEVCPQHAISREPAQNEYGFEMCVNADQCIGCGFCAACCPCGIWELVENEPLD
ncbi:FAD-dependent pyridine nucleotide-disulfide oxidoreductase [Candidatus Magnetomorum sp. HK-1]|nr:FAD-dependent pyridine nucleotide-disulfide oxidoreductase [Candidatus Magnetomorum sp. HK-1]